MCAWCVRRRARREEERGKEGVVVGGWWCVVCGGVWWVAPGWEEGEGRTGEGQNATNHIQNNRMIFSQKKHVKV